MNQLYLQALNLMDNTFGVLSRKVGNPEQQRLGSGYAYRYKEKSIYQAIVQKLARVLTSLRAVSLLNEGGMLQEQATLQRTLDEFTEDVMFLCFGLIFNEITNLHKEYLAAFYEEELDNPDSAFASTQKRPMIPRRKIRDFNTKNRGTGHDQSITKEVERTISKLYSGYVHGASPHLMELYYGDPPYFHLEGGIDSPYHADATDDLLNYYYRAILSFAFAAKAFSEKELFVKMVAYSRKFAVESGRENHLRDTKEI